MQRLISNGIFSAETSCIILYKSGRAAICALMTELKEKQGRQIAFIPDYICNVVPKACEDAGFVLKEYPTDEYFVPIWDQLEQRLCEDESSVLLICSLMGSSPVLAPEMKMFEQSHPKLFIVADECQNLVENSPVTLKRNRAIVFSFNDKTCPGLMGGGIVCSPESSLSPEYQQSSFKREMKCSIFFAGSLLKRITREARHILKLALRCSVYYRIPSNYEYSIFQKAHYDTRSEPIHRISAVYALLNLAALKQYAKVREENCRVLALATGCDVAIMQDGFSSLTAPAFMPLPQEMDVHSVYPSPVKAPYAKHKDPKTCNRKLYSIKVNIPYVTYHLL
ncbi:MAG: hypothetical protein K8R02_10085 [Anaerohalosphaeraceae bacterium]|nr:hypothetical protein [Anaerohalosphaeraceae bacterium]